MSKQSSAFQNMWVYLINAVITRKPKGIDLVHSFLRNLRKFSFIGLLGRNTYALIYQKNIHQPPPKWLVYVESERKIQPNADTGEILYHTDIRKTDRQTFSDL